MDNHYDVIVVGAGAAGVGMARVLQDLGVKPFILLERYAVGASFARWPSEMRFISPSFPSNGFGLLDLNAVAIATSPAHTLQAEHPSGKEYAAYLQALVNHFEIPVRAGVDVRRVIPDGDLFLVDTSVGAFTAHFVVWAAGEFQYPNTQVFAGAELCLHNATVESWQQMLGDDFVIIGGYESGIDAAVNLVRLGKRVRVLDDFAPWANRVADPSLALSPYTSRRLQRALATGRLELVQAQVEQVVRDGEGFAVQGVLMGDEQGQETPVVWQTPTPPILATGFVGSLSLISHHFEWHETYNYALLTENDESTMTPGLFMVGPMVRHGSLIFCFIYKFRQRFAIVGRAIGARLGLDTSVLEEYRRHQMLLEDLSCCDDTCAC